MLAETAKGQVMTRLALAPEGQRLGCATISSLCNIRAPDCWHMERAITVPASAEFMARARQEAVALLEAQGCPAECAFEVGMALQEALANAIIHGCRRDPRCSVTVRIQCDRSGASITVQDSGPGFEVTRVPDPASPTGRVSESGRGILLMRAYMDDVSFARGGREVRMRKSWAASSVAPA